MIAIVFESFVRAGSQRHLVEILKGLRLFRPELECCLFLIASPNASWGTLLPEVEKAGIPVIYAPYLYRRLDGTSLPARLYNWWSRNKSEFFLNEDFYRRLYGFKTIVCAQPFVADLLLPNLKSGQRFVFHLSEHMAQRSSAGFYRFLNNPKMNIVFQHQSQIDQLPIELDIGGTLTWPLRLCPDHFGSRQLASRVPSQDLKLAHYSRISPMRLIDQLIDAFALLREYTPATLRISGFIEDNTYYQQLLDQIHQLGLRDSVQFVDPVPCPAEDPARDEVDLVWMISLSGHVGYAGIESMAAGLPTLLLEVDSRASASLPDPELTSLICSTPEQLVQRTLMLQADSAGFCNEQRQLVRNRFMTTKEAINELVNFYLGSR